MTITDISVPLADGMPAWPGSPGFQSASLLAIARGDPANVSAVHMDVHTGTHVDAPRHFVESGDTLEAIALERYVGPAHVAAVGPGREISAALLERAGVPTDCERLLLRTANSDPGWLGDDIRFREDFAALTPDAATWLVQRDIALVGIDYMSIELYGRGSAVHVTLLEAGVVILEGLRLGHVEPGEYELICLPISVPGLEAAPVRAVLRARS